MHAFRKQTAFGICLVVLLLGSFKLPSDNTPKHKFILDDIHFYVNDPKAAQQFFTSHFRAHRLAKPERNPLPFVEYLEVRPGQAALAISPRGPYQGLSSQDLSRWRRVPVRLTPNSPPTYGVHWLALSTESLKLALQSLQKQNVKVLSTDVSVPGEPHAKAAMVWGPEFTRLLIVQRGGERRESTPYGIDHLLVLVQDLPENIRFFEEVYEGKVLKRDDDYCKMRIGDHIFILSKPLAVGLPPTTVKQPDSTQFRPGIEELGFLCKELEPAYQTAAIKGHEFMVRPSRVIYRNKPTPYVTALIRTPGGLYCGMYAEDGRESYRTAYVRPQTGAVAGNKKDNPPQQPK